MMVEFINNMSLKLSFAFALLIHICLLLLLYFLGELFSFYFFLLQNNTK